MIKIWRPPHVAFAANILASKLQDMGKEASIVDNVNPSDTCLYIIYNAASVKRLPINYIVYQTEVAGSKWFSAKYEKTLKNALAIWEYNPQNIKAYEHINSNISIVSPGVDAQVINVKKDIPLLFYGYVRKSPIRTELLSSLKNEIDITIIENQLTENMWDILSRTALVLNIHYYDNAPLETFRINEALSFGCHVISQRSPLIPEQYKNIVRFADSHNDIVRLATELSRLNTPLDHSSINCLCNHKEIEQAIQRPLKLKEKRRFFDKLFT